MRTKKIAKGFIAIMLTLALVGCAGFLENTYKGEYVSASAYSVGMQTISNLQKAGTITADVRAKVNAKALIFYNSYMVAVDALATYYQAKDQNSQQIVQTAITAMFASWADLAALINSIVPNTVPTTMMTLKGVTPNGEPTEVTVKKLDAGTISIIIQIGSAVVQFILPEIAKVINVINQKTVSLEEIQALKTLIKLPELY